MMHRYCAALLLSTVLLPVSSLAHADTASSAVAQAPVPKSAHVILAQADPSPGDSSLEARLQTLEAEVRAIREHQAVSASSAAPPAPHVAQNSANNRFSLVSADGNYSIALTGRLHLDLGDYVDFEPQSAVVGTQSLSSGFNVRRARIGVTGHAYDWNYTFIYDFGNSQDSGPAGLETAQVSYAGFKGVLIDLPGYGGDSLFTLDTSTSSNDIMFMERATPDNVATGINTGDFRANTGVRVFGDRYWLGAYITGPKNGDTHTNAIERLGSFQRATVQALSGPDYSLHIGIGIDELFQVPNTGPGTARTITLSDQPELRIDPTVFVTTPALGTVAHPVNGAMIYNPELAAGYQSLFFQGEYYAMSVDRVGLSTLNFNGAYGEVSWTVTGEHRNYIPTTGAYSGITPDHPFSTSTGSWGAWELAARISYVGLTDQFVPGQSLASQANAVDGGKQTDITLGANWYLNSYMRIMFNYVHSDYQKVNGTAVAGAALGVPVGAKIQAIAMRTQLVF